MADNLSELERRIGPDLPREPLRGHCASFRNMAVTFPFPGLAVIRLPNSTRAVNYLLLGIFGVAFAFIPYLVDYFFVTGTFAFPDHWHDAIFHIVFPIMGGFVFILGVLGALGLLTPKPIILDLRQGLAWSSGRRADPALRSGVPLRDVAAVQLCSGWSGDDENKYMAWQVNLVLSAPSGQRVRLLYHGFEEGVRADAQLLAEFLQVPLLDHAQTSQQMRQEMPRFSFLDWLLPWRMWLRLRRRPQDTEKF